MSKLAKKPVAIKEGVTVEVLDKTLKVNGPKGNLTFMIPEGINVKIIDNKGIVELQDKDNEDLNHLLGLTRATLANMITGVSSGFERKLELSGVGFRAQLSGNDLMLNIGFSHPVKVASEPGIKFEVKENIITVSGIDKEKIGDMAAKIREIRPPDPYKEKGIKYFGEHVRRKAGKAAKALGATK